MTRINADLNPKYLADQHLMAEYRELPMVYASLRRSLAAKNSNTLLTRIPPDFTLNKGHVTFFYSKLKFLDTRYKLLIKELKSRGFELDKTRTFDLSEFPKEFHTDWSSSSKDRKIIKSRIREKLLLKPEWYKYHGQPFTRSTIKSFYGI